jgi:hypothetical protein
VSRGTASRSASRASTRRPSRTLHRPLRGCPPRPLQTRSSCVADCWTAALPIVDFSVGPQHEVCRPGSALAARRAPDAANWRGRRFSVRFRAASTCLPPRCSSTAGPCYLGQRRNPSDRHLSRSLGDARRGGDSRPARNHDSVARNGKDWRSLGFARPFARPRDLAQSCGLGEQERTGANACSESTSWGSLVRAQYRP